MELQQALSIWWLTYAKEGEKRSNATVAKLENDQEVILKLLTFIHNSNRVHLPNSAEKRPSRLHTQLMYFNLGQVTSSLQPDINKFPSAS